jgi:hypothetical protein
MDNDSETLGITAGLRAPRAVESPSAQRGVIVLRDRFRAARRFWERIAAQAPLRFSLFAILFLLTLAVVVLQPSYDTNDDVFMTMIVAGKGFCPAPDEHLIFTNIIIGQSLKHLYTAWPEVPWYGCYLLLVHYVSQVVLLYCALAIDRGFVPNGATQRADPSSANQGGTRRRLLLYLVHFAVVELLFLNSLQFTTTAFLAAEAGIFLFVLAARWRVEQPDAAVAGPLAMAGFLLLVAGLIRMESLSLALLSAAPLGFVVACRATRRVLVPCGIATGLSAMLILLATTYNRMAYERDPRWSAFLGYNTLRVKFNDYGWTRFTPQTAPIFSAVGWTENDHDMIAHWFFDDSAVYSEEHLRSILEAYPWKTARLTRDYFWQLCRGLPRDRSVWAIILVLPFFFICLDRSSQARGVIIGCAITAVLLVAFLTWNYKLLPRRVYLPLLSFPLSAALLFSAAPAAQGGRKARYGLRAWRATSPWTRAVSLFLVVGVVAGVYHQCRRTMRVHQERRLLESFLADLQPAGHELYICWESAMPFELVSPFDNLHSWSNIPLLNLVWTQRTPWQEQIKQRFNISNLAEAICERDNIVLVATPTHRLLFTIFANEHFHADVQFVESKVAGDKFTAGHFQRRALPRETASSRTDPLQQVKIQSSVTAR